MNREIDLNFRPTRYFRPQALDRYLLSKIKGSVAHAQIKTLLDAGKRDEVARLLTDGSLSSRTRAILEAWHPMYMGGNYLPDTNVGEVEIARITIRSTTYDVTSVYARFDKATIRYKVVDEYGGDTLRRPTKNSSALPMTLNELTDFFLGAWSLIGVLRMNFGNDLDKSLKFFTARSEFYPDLDELVRRRVAEAFTPKSDDEEDLPELFR